MKSKNNSTKHHDITPSKNIIRVINPEAIKLRLAIEGKNFNPNQTKSTKKNFPLISKKHKEQTKATNINTKQKKSTKLLNIQKQNITNKIKKKHNTIKNKNKQETINKEYNLWLNSEKKKKNKISINKQTNKIKTIEIDQTISIYELSKKINIKPNQLISKLIEIGTMATVNQLIDFNTATLIAKDFQYETKNILPQELSENKTKTNQTLNTSVRSPIITVMGHVNHGKTSILDAIKNTNTVQSEFGKITQHITADYIKTEEGVFTFLDTPGHESFIKMRERGTFIADIIVLVIAANDGIMPQTKEIIQHAKKSKTTIIVAINKIDLPSSNIKKIIQQLSEHGLIAESWGGDTQIHKISALHKKGIKSLLEGITLQAELMELKTNKNKTAEGFVIETRFNKKKGSIVTLLIYSGTLTIGDHIVTKNCHGKIKAMYNSYKHNIKLAYPSMPVNILGLSRNLQPGDSFKALPKNKKIKKNNLNKNKKLIVKVQIPIKKILLTKNLTLRIIIKTDVCGSTEAIFSALTQLKTEKIKIEIIYNSVGIVTENDIKLAKMSKAIIIGFNIQLDQKIQRFADKNKVYLKTYNVIYDAIKETKKLILTLLKPALQKKYIGKAKVKMIISVSDFGKIAGSYVIEGKIIKPARVEIVRNNTIVGICNIIGLKQFKLDRKEISSGAECGILLSKPNIIKKGDIIECFQKK